MQSETPSRNAAIRGLTSQIRFPSRQNTNDWPEDPSDMYVRQNTFQRQTDLYAMNETTLQLNSAR